MGIAAVAHRLPYLFHHRDAESDADCPETNTHFWVDVQAAQLLMVLVIVIEPSATLPLEYIIILVVMAYQVDTTSQFQPEIGRDLFVGEAHAELSVDRQGKLWVAKIIQPTPTFNSHTIVEMFVLLVSDIKRKSM